MARHGLAAGRLPRHHNDPFDRVMIAQALAEDLVLVSRDHLFVRYGVRLLQT
jgi:PIN domain nuclease of toxin-antitoxin system